LLSQGFRFLSWGLSLQSFSRCFHGMMQIVLFAFAHSYRSPGSSSQTRRRRRESSSPELTTRARTGPSRLEGFAVRKKSAIAR
jgi:hypothetical protein